MELRRESLKVLSCSEMRVELGHIRHPVAMVWIAVDGRGALVILIYRTDPNWRGPEFSEKSERIEVAHSQ